MSDNGHKWYGVVFNYAQWIECECGFTPTNEHEFTVHSTVHDIDTEQVES